MLSERHHRAVEEIRTGQVLRQQMRLEQLHSQPPDQNAELADGRFHFLISVA